MSNTNNSNNEFKDEDILSLFGKEEIDKIQNRLAKVTGLGFITVNYKGEPLTDFTDFCPFCQNFRHDPELHHNCESSDAISSIQASVLKRPNIYQCPCGLMEIAIPIIVNGTYLGGLLCGQATCVNEPSTLQRMTPMIDNDHFRETLSKVELQKKELPAYTYEKFQDIANLASMVVEMLCENKIQEIQHSRVNERKIEILKKQQDLTHSIRVARNSKDYLKYITEVMNTADYVYTNASLIEEDFLNINTSLHSEECLKLYPLDPLIIHHKKELEQWMYKCADYEYRQTAILSYPILENILIYINQHLEEDISLSTIVEYCNISQGYISKLFRKCFGITAMDYIHIRKVNLAKDLMLHSNQSIGDISFELSYGEPGYFSKIFKKYTGQSAMEYRNK